MRTDTMDKRPSQKAESVVALKRKPISGRRAVGSPRRRADEVITAAAEVFAQRGYHGATTQDIADHLGIRQASLYYYIPSKEAALEQVCVIGTEGLVEGAKAISAMPISASEKLERAIHAHVKLVRERHAFMRVFLHERQHLPEPSRHQIGRLSRSYEQVMQELIASGVASGEFREDVDPRVTMFSTIGLCNSAAAWYPRLQGISVESLAQAIGRMVVEGIKARDKTGSKSRRLVRSAS